MYNSTVKFAVNGFVEALHESVILMSFEIPRFKTLLETAKQAIKLSHFFHFIHCFFA